VPRYVLFSARLNVKAQRRAHLISGTVLITLFAARVVQP
jgi:hypothetical protein